MSAAQALDETELSALPDRRRQLLPEAPFALRAFAWAARGLACASVSPSRPRTRYRARRLSTWPLRDIHLDDVRRAGDVHGRARGDHDSVADLDEAGIAGGFDRTAPEVLDVVALRDKQRRHAPFES